MANQEALRKILLQRLLEQLRETVNVRREPDASLQISPGDPDNAQLEAVRNLILQLEGRDLGNLEPGLSPGGGITARSFPSHPNLEAAYSNLAAEEALKEAALQQLLLNQGMRQRPGGSPVFTQQGMLGNQVGQSASILEALAQMLGQ